MILVWGQEIVTPSLQDSGKRNWDPVRERQRRNDTVVLFSRKSRLPLSCYLSGFGLFLRNIESCTIIPVATIEADRR